MYVYIVVRQMTKSPHFHHLTNQRIAATTITLQNLADDEMLFNEDICASGHSTEVLTKKIVWASVNAILHNYCS